MDTQADGWDAEAADRAVAMLKAIADPARYRLLWLLSRGEYPVSVLAESIGAHVAATSQHLARLRAAGLVTTRREGTRIFYRIAGRGVRGLLEEAALAAEQPAADGDADAGDGAADAVRAEAAHRAAALRPATGR